MNHEEQIARYEQITNVLERIHDEAESRGRHIGPAVSNLVHQLKREAEELEQMLFGQSAKEYQA